MQNLHYCPQMRWHKQHLRTVTGKVREYEYEVFKHLCEADGKTPYTVVCELVRSYMMSAGYEPPKPKSTFAAFSVPR